MLIKVTNYCSMGCSHCMEGSTVAGEHMSMELFRKALDLTARLESLAWSHRIPPVVLLSGGECTEHAEIISFIEEVHSRNWFPMLITNGMWLDNPELRASILRPEWANKLCIQITNDPRYYPKRPTEISTDHRILFVDNVAQIIPLGRAAKRKHASTYKAPSSFNLRSATRAQRDVCAAILMLRSRAMQGMSGNCSPSISSDGTLVAGETNSCYPIGNVDSTPAEVTRKLMTMECNKCGLEDNLTQKQKVALGIARIHLL